MRRSSGILHYCGQTAGWMKTPLGTEVVIGAGHIVLDGYPALRERGTAPPPSFRPMSIVATVAHLSYCWALVQTVAQNSTVILPNFRGHFLLTLIATVKRWNSPLFDEQSYQNHLDDAIFTNKLHLGQWYSLSWVEFSLPFAISLRYVNSRRLVFNA